MSDVELLKCLQQELISTLKQRQETKIGQYYRSNCCKAKIHRLRLQIQEVMLRIERKCEGLMWRREKKEEWE